MLPGLPHCFGWSSTPVYYCECKWEIKTGEAWEQCYLFHMWGQTVRLPVPLSGPFFSISTCAQPEVLNCIPEDDRCYIYWICTIPHQQRLAYKIVASHWGTQQWWAIKLRQCGTVLEQTAYTKSLTTVKVAVGHVHQGRWATSHTCVIHKEVATATV